MLYSVFSLPCGLQFSFTGTGLVVNWANCSRVCNEWSLILYSQCIAKIWQLTICLSQRAHAYKSHWRLRPGSVKNLSSFITLLWLYTNLIYSFWVLAIGLWHLGNIHLVYQASVLWCFMFSDIDTLQENWNFCRNLCIRVDKMFMGPTGTSISITWPSFMALCRINGP